MLPPKFASGSTFLRSVLVFSAADSSYLSHTQHLIILLLHSTAELLNILKPLSQTPAMVHTNSKSSSSQEVTAAACRVSADTNREKKAFLIVPGLDN